MEKRQNIAGMSIHGGRKDNFYLCLLEYYSDSDRWFLKSVLPVKDEEEADGDVVIRNWIEKYSLCDLVVDAPLTSPVCETCALECPGAYNCPEISIREVRKKVNKILREDREFSEKDPKQYEMERKAFEEVDYSKDILAKNPGEHILSKSFKRRLKKGFLPYWNRTLDFWVWLNYYDQLLDLFNISYDSFGNISLMLLSRFSYLRRHFPRTLELYEGNSYITLIELLRAKIIKRSQVINFSHIEKGPTAKYEIIKAIEQHLKIFIYDNDVDVLIKNPRAFDSFLLALSGQRLHLDQTNPLPGWAMPDETKFVVPLFPKVTP